MRKLLISLMAASMLVPAAAYAEEGGLLRGMRNHAERSNSRDDNNDNRSSRSQSAQHSERSNDDRPARVERAPRSDRAPRPERVQQVEQAGVEDHGVRRIERVHRRDRPVQQDVESVEQAPVQERVQRTRQVERRRDGLAGGFTQIARDTADGRPSDRDNDRDWRRDRDGNRDGRWRDRDGDGRRWSGDWRRDRRYDWSNHRSRYSSLYRLGRYYDPYGWGYRRFSIGFSLWPSYYGSNYWLNDPWQYRLPPAYGPYRWVRYYDDALMVNTYTGEVVDVIHNFFW